MRWVECQRQKVAVVGAVIGLTGFAEPVAAVVGRWDQGRMPLREQ